MRSMLGPALVRPQITASPLAATLLPLLSAGELIGDKLPGAPNRIIAPSVIFRSASGAAVAASVYKTEQESPAVGAVLGIAGALAATYGIFYLRQTASRRTALPNAALGLIEDVAAYGIGRLMLR
jgi:uncharacterized membrane protein